ncbi:MAG: hypothetical protein J5715_03040 [Clostridiales bacterium]|nr:hypothetical protein [Clostridiales bacterium]
MKNTKLSTKTVIRFTALSLVICMMFSLCSCKREVSEVSLEDFIKAMENVCGKGSSDASGSLSNDLGVIPSGILLDANDDTYDLSNFDKDLIVNGINFKRVVMKLDEDKVTYLSFSIRESEMNKKREDLPVKETYDTLYSALCDLYGDPIEGYKEGWNYFVSSGVSGWKDGDYTVSAFWGDGYNEDMKNDQFVITVKKN